MPASLPSSKMSFALNIVMRLEPVPRMMMIGVREAEAVGNIPFDLNLFEQFPVVENL